MDPGSFYVKTHQMKTRGKIVNIPVDSEDETLSDDEEYLLKPIEAVYIEESSDDTENESDKEEDQTNICSENEEEEIIIIKKSDKKKAAPKLIWTEDSTCFNEEDISFLGTQDLPSEIMKLNTPIDFFEYLFTKKAWLLIEEQTNLLAEQTQGVKAVRITSDDLRQFMGILIYMSVVRLPSTRSYWSNSTRIEAVAKTMSCNKFENIKRFLHFADKTKEMKENNVNFDKLQKIRPLINIFLEKLKEVPREEYMAIDEQMIPTKSKTSGMRQYNSKKPHKWGYLNYVLSGASGFSYDFDIFTGKHSTELPDNHPDLRVTGNIVTRFLKTVPHNLNYKIFIDNYYTSLNLMSYLHSIGILPLGTMLLDRAKDFGLSKKSLMEHERGYCVEKSTMVNDVKVTLTSWVDNKPVNFCSTYVGKEPMITVKRWAKVKNKDKGEKSGKIVKPKTKKTKLQRINVPAPKAVEIYNKYMGGVDLLDSMLGFYRIKVRSKKWYHRIFFHLLDMICVNSWLLWRRKQVQKNDPTYLPLLDFKLYIAEVLMRQTLVLTPSRKPGRPTLSVNTQNTQQKKTKRRAIELPPQEVVGDCMGHWPVWTKDRQRCKLCELKAHIACSKCEVSLCLNKDRNCFTKFHNV